jgi:hypothetical protein
MKNLSSKVFGASLDRLLIEKWKFKILGASLDEELLFACYQLQLWTFYIQYMKVWSDCLNIF